MLRGRREGSGVASTRAFTFSSVAIYFVGDDYVIDDENRSYRPDFVTLTRSLAGTDTGAMPFNVVASDDAVLAVAVEIEAERAKDASYPWTIELFDVEGPVLYGDDDGVSERHHRSLVDITRRHGEIVVVTGDVFRDDDTGEVLNADLVRYSKGPPSHCSFGPRR